MASSQKPSEQNRKYKLIRQFFKTVDSLPLHFSGLIRFVLGTGMYPLLVNDFDIKALKNFETLPPLMSDSELLLGLTIQSTRQTKMSEIFVVHAMATFTMDALAYLIKEDAEQNETDEDEDQVFGALLTATIEPFTSLDALRVLQGAL